MRLFHNMQLVHHKTLTVEKWAILSLTTQLLNVGSELSRAREMRVAGSRIQEERAYERALELLDITLAGKHSLAELRELTRLREAICSLMVKSELAVSLDELYEYILQFSVLK